MVEAVFVAPRDAAEYIRAHAKYGEVFIAHPLGEGRYVVILGSLTDDYSIVMASIMPASDVERLRRDGAAILISEHVAGTRAAPITYTIRAAEQVVRGSDQS